MPDYLAVGSDEDFVRVPLGLDEALTVARRFGFTLPTRKIVNTIHSQAEARLDPKPMPAGAAMTSVAYLWAHNRTIEEQQRRLPSGTLVSGTKKDVVLTPRLASFPGRVAIYGWLRPDGAAIQPLSTVHGAWYADYSHGIRLVSDTVFVDGQARSVFDVLEDPAQAGLLSDEGPDPNARRLLGPEPEADAAGGQGGARRLAAPETEVVVRVALRVPDPGPVPERSAPPAPVLVRPEVVEGEPAPLHLGHAQLPAAAARHLALVERQVHVLRRVAVQVEDAERAAAPGKGAGRERVRAAPVPAAARATRGLVAGRSADAAPVRRDRRTRTCPPGGPRCARRASGGRPPRRRLRGPGRIDSRAASSAPAQAPSHSCASQSLFPSASHTSAASLARIQTTGSSHGMSGNSNWSMQERACSGPSFAGS